MMEKIIYYIGNKLIFYIGEKYVWKMIGKTKMEKRNKYLTNELNYVYSTMIKDHVDENEFVIIENE